MLGSFELLWVAYWRNINEVIIIIIIIVQALKLCLLKIGYCVVSKIISYPFKL